MPTPTPASIAMCRYAATGGGGCASPNSPEGSCQSCHGAAKAVKDSYRPVIATSTWDEVESALSAAQGAQCWVCKREPVPKGLTFKNLAVCATCAPAASGRDMMNDVTEAERESLLEGVDRAGEYLASLNDDSKFDLRNIQGAELDSFLAHLLCGYSQAMRQRAEATPPF